MTTRETYGSATVGPIAGDAFMDNVGSHIGRLYDASCLPLTAVTGVDDIAATLDPVLLSGLVDGMKVTLTWPAANTGAMTLALNGGPATPILDVNGAAMAPATVAPGQRALLEVIGGSWRHLNASSASGGGMAARYREQFDASGTWSKPADLDDDTMVVVEIWAGGGGGDNAANGGGGGGGAFNRHLFRVGDLPGAVSVTIGAGGAINASGGATSFGALLEAYGGGRGGTSADFNGGGGGGSAEIGVRTGGGCLAGGVGAGAAGSGGQDGGPATLPGAGGGGGSYDLSAGSGDGGGSYSGGGGGGGYRANGGASVLGGGGGGGDQGIGGASLFGGAGGADSVAGSVPGGGGGRNAAGGAGRVIVWC